MKFYIRELQDRRRGEFWKARWRGYTLDRHEAHAYSKAEILEDLITCRRLKEGTLRLVYAYD